MKIFAILLVKNEIDILDDFLNSTAAWADKIFVLDNGSTDGTWEALQKARNDRVVVWKQDNRVFSNSLRGDVFRKFRTEANKGDWWCTRADVDEFYLEDPRHFLESVPWYYHVVEKKSLEFCLTKDDVTDKTFSGCFAEDRDKLTYIKPFLWAEPRFIRESAALRWKEGARSPKSFGLTYPGRILCSHYQVRSPQQLRKRFAARAEAKRATKEKIFSHVSFGKWEDELWEKEQAVLYLGDETQKSLPIKKKKNDHLIKKLYNKVIR